MKKQKRKVEVRVGGLNYTDKDPINDIMDTLERYDEGTPPRKAIGCTCDHQGE